MTTEQLVVGLDVGTTKVAVLAAAVEPDGALDLVAGAQVLTTGVRQGVVVNMDEVTRAVAEAMDRAEQLCGRKLGAAVVALGGRHLAATNSRGAVAITPGGREIQYEDIVRAIEAARAGVALGENREVVHQLPRGYLVDDQDGVPNPIGMVGYKLEVETHVVLASAAGVQNLARCVRGAQVEPQDLVAAPLAAAGAVLTPAEREIGTMVVDIGGGTSGVAIFAQGFPWLTLELPGGGAAITYGIAAALRLPLDVAERLKVEQGHADPRRVAADDLIELDDEALVVPRSELARVIQAEAGDLLAGLRQPLQQAQQGGMRPLGLVVTGGTAQLPGLAELAGRVLGLPARVGAPRHLRGAGDGLSGPPFATAAGLLLWGAQQLNGARPVGVARDRGPRLGPLGTRVRHWVQAFLP
jgi:cell division protein FtsA